MYPVHSSRRDFLKLVGTGVVGISAGGFLAACGDDSGDDTGRAELVFWDNALGEAAETPESEWFITKAVNRFNAESSTASLSRSRQSHDVGTWHTQLRAAFIAKNGPDIVTLYAGGDVTSFAPFLAPLDEHFPEQFRADYVGWETVREDFKPDGRIMAIPFGSGQYFVVLYNKDLMAQAGLADFTPPANWDELIRLAEQVKAGGVTPIVMGEQEGWTGAWLISALAGGQIGTEGFFDMRAGKLPVTDASMIAAYENYAKLFSMDLTNPDATSTGNVEAGQLFIQEKGAMTIQSGWFNREAVERMGDKVANFPIPTLPGPHQGGILGGPTVAMAITNYSERQTEAVEFLKFMLQPDVLDMYAERGIEASNYKDADHSTIQNPLLKSQIEWLKDNELIYPFDNIMPQNVNELMYRTNASVFAGDTTPQDAVETLQDELEKGS